MNEADGNSHALLIFDVSDMSHALSMLRLPKYESAASFTWVSDTRLASASRGAAI